MNQSRGWKSDFRIVLSIFTTICIAVLFFPAVGSACTCVQNPDALTAMGKAEAVFTGKVLNIKQERKQEGFTGAIEYKDVNLFEIDQTWKGIDQSQIMIYDHGHEESCGFVFEEGKSYLVYAYKGKDGNLYTSLCSRTTELSDAAEDLDRLDEGKSVKEKVNLEGEMKRISNKDYDMEMFIIGGLIIAAAGVFLITRKTGGER